MQMAEPLEKQPGGFGSHELVGHHYPREKKLFLI
jgi:hypothetical protein